MRTTVSVERFETVVIMHFICNKYNYYIISTAYMYIIFYVIHALHCLVCRVASLSTCMYVAPVWSVKPGAHKSYLLTAKFIRATCLTSGRGELPIFRCMVSRTSMNIYVSQRAKPGIPYTKYIIDPVSHDIRRYPVSHWFFYPATAISPWSPIPKWVVPSR